MIANDLQQTFNHLFNEEGIPNTTSCSNAIKAFSRKHRQFQASASPVDTLPRPTITYEEPMSVFIEDFVEMVTLLFGDLGIHQPEHGKSRLFKRCLGADVTHNMFDDLGKGPSPPDQYNNYQTLQMIDIWFSHHPLAFILSKTLLLRSYRDGTHNEILLAVILADVNFARQEPEIRAKGQDMFDWAKSKLFDIPNASIELSTVQALTLLGWYELCATRARRSICYFLHANRIVSSLEMPNVQVNKINGMDIGEVEAEVATSVRWLTFSIILWAFMQMDAPLLDLLPLSLSARFPPSNESTSSVFALDSASDNISTLRQQAKAIRDLWPISHIASTTAHIYALSPQEQGSVEGSDASSWQSNTLHRLRQLSKLQQHPSQDLSGVCSNIRHVLVGALKLLEAHSGYQTSQALLLSAYHTMIIHFLFPRTPDTSASIVVTDGLINDFCYSARSLLRVSPALDDSLDCGGMGMGILPATIGEVFALALDTCGRVLAHIQARSTSFKLESEGRLLLSKHEELARLGSDLHDLSKHEKLRQSKRTKAVKKQLKQVMETFDDESSDNALSLEFPSVGSEDPLSMDTNPSMPLQSDFIPGLTYSPTENSSSTTPLASRVPSNNPMLPSTFSLYDQNTLNIAAYDTNASFYNTPLSGLEWGAADVLDPRATDFTATANLGVQDKAGPRGFKVYHDHGKTGGGACFDDSAFRPR